MSEGIGTGSPPCPRPPIHGAASRGTHYVPVPVGTAPVLSPPPPRWTRHCLASLFHMEAAPRKVSSQPKTEPLGGGSTGVGAQTSQGYIRV